jgi:hypothetical protein
MTLKMNEGFKSVRRYFIGAGQYIIKANRVKSIKRFYYLLPRKIKKSNIVTALNKDTNENLEDFF